MPPGLTSQIAKTLQEWVHGCDTITICIDEQIEQANSEKYKRLKNSERVELEVRLTFIYSQFIYVYYKFAWIFVDGQLEEGDENTNE